MAWWTIDLWRNCHRISMVAMGEENRRRVSSNISGKEGGACPSLFSVKSASGYLRFETIGLRKKSKQFLILICAHLRKSAAESDSDLAGTGSTFLLSK